MALTLVFLAIAAASTSAHHPFSRDGWPHHPPPAAEPIWLWNPAEGTTQAKNIIAPFVRAPSHAQAVRVLDDRTGEVFVPLSANFPSSAQPTDVRIINSPSDLYRTGSAEDEASSSANVNRPTTVFTLAPKASGFSNAPSSVSFASPSTAYLVNPQPTGAHVIRAAYPANTAAFTQTPTGSTIIPLTLTSGQNLGRSPSSFVISQSPLNSAPNTLPTLVAVPWSRAAGHDEFSNSPAGSSIIPLAMTSGPNLGRSPSTYVISQSSLNSAPNTLPTLVAVPWSKVAGHNEFSDSSSETAEGWADISCPRGFTCSAQPAVQARFRV